MTEQYLTYSEAMEKLELIGTLVHTDVEEPLSQEDKTKIATTHKDSKVINALLEWREFKGLEKLRDLLTKANKDRERPSLFISLRKEKLPKWFLEKYPANEDLEKFEKGVGVLNRELYTFQDVEFVWDKNIYRYSSVNINTSSTFPFVNIDDLTSLAYSLNEENSQDPEFMKQFGIVDKWSFNVLEKSENKVYIILDNLANQILARCIIIANRLTHGEDKVSEENIMNLAFMFQKCGKIPNPKEADEEKIEEITDKALNGDKELLQRIVDLPYVADWVKEKLEEE